MVSVTLWDKLVTTRHSVTRRSKEFADILMGGIATGRVIITYTYTTARPVTARGRRKHMWIAKVGLRKDRTDLQHNRIGSDNVHPSHTNRTGTITSRWTTSLT